MSSGTSACILGSSVLTRFTTSSVEASARFVTGMYTVRRPLTRAYPVKTSLLFWGRGAERPGWLVRCLDEFARRDINLTKIESRPRRKRLGSYMFFADLSGRATESPVAEAIAGVSAVCEEVRVLGSYRAAATPDIARLRR